MDRLHPSSQQSGPGLPFAVRPQRGPSGQVRLTATGELDFETAGILRQAVDAAYRRRAAVLELDLSGVSFCDCAGLNTLLRPRAQAVSVGCLLRIQAAGPYVSRVLDLTGTAALFPGVPARSGRAAGLGLDG
jgi:anti-anti-sigma factor